MPHLVSRPRPRRSSAVPRIYASLRIRLPWHRHGGQAPRYRRIRRTLSRRVVEGSTFIEHNEERDHGPGIGSNLDRPRPPWPSHRPTVEDGCISDAARGAVGCSVGAGSRCEVLGSRRRRLGGQVVAGSGGPVAAAHSARHPDVHGHWSGQVKVEPSAGGRDACGDIDDPRAQGGPLCGARHSGDGAGAGRRCAAATQAALAAYLLLGRGASGSSLRAFLSYATLTRPHARDGSGLSRGRPR
jgi:hypothetical protein